MRKIEVRDFGTFEYEPSLLEQFIESLAAEWKLEMSELLPEHLNCSLKRRSYGSGDLKEHLRLLEQGNYEEDEKMRCNEGVLKFGRGLLDGVHNDMRRRDYKDKDYLNELYSANELHQETAEIIKDEKKVNIEFAPETSYKVKLYLPDVKKFLPHPECQDLWFPLSFRAWNFMELKEAQDDEEKAGEIGVEDAFSFLRNYFGIKENR
jgi:hypothetical protein